MPGVFVGSTELTTVGDIKIGGTDVQEVFVGATKVFPTDDNASDYDFVFGASFSLPSDWTFTRTTTAYIRGSSGLLTSVSSGTIRDDHYNEAGTALGGLFEPARTNSALHARDLTNAAWVKSANMDSAKDADGVDGVTNSASTIGANGGTNQTALQSVTISSDDFIYSAHIKRKTGTGTIEITIDNGVSWTDVTSSINNSTYSQVQVKDTAANPTFGFRIATDGDEIEVDMCQLEAGETADANASTPIPTTTTAVPRNRDELSFSGSGGDIDAPHSTVAEGQFFQLGGGLEQILTGDVDNISRSVRFLGSGKARCSDSSANATTANATAVNTDFKAGGAYSGSTLRACLNGGTVAENTGGDSGFQIDDIASAGGARGYHGTFTRLRIWLSELSASELQDLTT